MNTFNFSHHSLSPDSYYDHIKTINCVKFTPREIDVIACLLSGKGSKTIASFLSIEEKTVETHKYNVMRKLECNSKEGIIHFIEQSDKFSALKHHYLSLLREAIFEKYLRQILSLSNRKGLDCLLVYEQNKNLTSLINQLEKHLALAGVKVVKEARENHKSMNHLIHYAHSCEIDSIAYLVSESSLKKIINGDNHAILEIAEITQKHEHAKRKVVFLLEGEKPLLDIPQEIKDTGYIGLGGHENYYFCVFDILQTLLPDINLDKTISNFRKQYETGYDPFERSSSKHSTNENDISEAEYLKINSNSRNLKKRKWGFIASCSLVLSIGCLLFVLKYNKENKTVSQNVAQNLQVVRSDLPIPTDNVFLHRPELMKQIDEKLTGEQDIQTIALVGIGGAGKTTIARQYARLQKSPIVWEINAETKAVLVESFEKFANDFAKTEEDKRALRRLMDIKDSTFREEEILHFVKKNLRSQQNWILIYDNVERFADVQKYFPHDSNTWGKGKVIVTTRDSTIQNNSHIRSTITIGELESEEKVNLFMNIMGKGETNPIAGLAQTEIIKFLDELPPFPLDISLAAFYLKTTNIPYPGYLENIRKHNKDFEATQEKMLKEASSYTKTRYNIVALTIKNIININKDFEDLLLLICILDSQNIPRKLLDNCKNSATVDDFIYNLKKYSLVTNDVSLSSQSTSNLSIHRSTQMIGLNYLIKAIDIKGKSLLISKVLENHITSVVDKMDYPIIKILGRHCEVVLNHRDLLATNAIGSIEGKLGSIYFYLGNYIKAKQILEKSLQKLNENDIKDRARISQTLVYLGMVYRKFGDNEKAKNLLEQSLAIYEKDFPNNHLEYAWALGNLGTVSRNLGNYEKSKVLFEKTLAIYEKHFDKSYIGNAWALAHLGNIYRYLGNYEKAQNYLGRSILIYKNNLPSNHIEIGWALVNLGKTYRGLGKYVEAENMLTQALKMYEEQFGKDHIDVVWILGSLGRIYSDLGNFEKARDILKKGYDLQKSYHIKNPTKDAWHSTLLGGAYKDLGYYHKAKELLEASLKIHEKQFGRDHIFTAWGMEYLGEFHKDTGNYEIAENLLKQSLKIYEDKFGKDHIKTARILRNLGEVYLLQGHLDDAESQITKALMILSENKHPERYKALEYLTEILLKKSISEKNVAQVQRYRKQAMDYLNQALAIAKAHFPADSPHILRVQAKLNDLKKRRSHL